MIAILKWMFGYATIRLSGAYVETFLNHAAHQKILLFHVEYREDCLVCCAGEDALPKLNEIAKKTGVKMSLMESHGLPGLLKRYQKRSFLLFFVVLSFLFLYGMSFFIWDIEVVGNETYQTSEVRNYITKHYVTAGQRIKTVDTKKLEEALRTHYDAFAFVSCEMKGTCLIVHIKETIPIKNKAKNEAPCNLLAHKDGVVISIITRSGTPLVKKGDTVKKGQILISGVISYQNDAKETYEEALVPADGDIVIKTLLPYQDSFSLSYYEKKKMKEYKHGFGIRFFDKDRMLWEPSLSEKEYDQTEKIWHFKLGRTFYFPFAVIHHKYEAYSLVRKTYTEARAKEVAKKHLKNYFRKLSKKGLTITQNNVKIERKGDQMCATVTLTVLEATGKISLIDENAYQKESEHESDGETH